MMESKPAPIFSPRVGPSEVTLGVFGTESVSTDLFYYSRKFSN